MTNREKIAHAQTLVDEVKADEAIGPACYGHLAAARGELEHALGFVLDSFEQDRAKRHFSGARAVGS